MAEDRSGESAAAGWQPARKRYKIVFSQPEMAGLEIITHSMSMGDMLHISSLLDIRGGQGRLLDPVKTGELLEMFAGVLVEWNLRYPEGHRLAGQATPTTAEGMLLHDPELVLQVILAWALEIGGIQVPLDLPSTGTEPLPVESLPMEALTESLTS